MTKNTLLLFFALFATMVAGYFSISAIASDLPPVTLIESRDYTIEAALMKEKHLPMVLLVSAEYCHFCHRAKENWFKPMIRSGQYTDKALLRIIELDDAESLIDFQGQKTSAGAFMARYGVFVTPMVLFLNSDGKMVSETIAGIADAEEFFGAYLEAGIQNSLACIRENKCTQ